MTETDSLIAQSTVIPREISKGVMRTIASGGRFALRTATRQEEARHAQVGQAFMKLFEGRFFLNGNLLEIEGSDDDVEEQVNLTAEQLAHQDTVSPGTTVEVRYVLPEEDLRDAELTRRREHVAGQLYDTLS